MITDLDMVELNKRSKYRWTAQFDVETDNITFTTVYDEFWSYDSKWSRGSLRDKNVSDIVKALEQGMRGIKRHTDSIRIVAGEGCSRCTQCECKKDTKASGSSNK